MRMTPTMRYVLPILAGVILGTAVVNFIDFGVETVTAAITELVRFIVRRGFRDVPIPASYIVVWELQLPRLAAAVMFALLGVAVGRRILTQPTATTDSSG